MALRQEEVDVKATGKVVKHLTVDAFCPVYGRTVSVFRTNRTGKVGVARSTRAQ